MFVLTSLLQSPQHGPGRDPVHPPTTPHQRLSLPACSLYPSAKSQCDKTHRLSLRLPVLAANLAFHTDISHNNRPREIRAVPMTLIHQRTQTLSPHDWRSTRIHVPLLTSTLQTLSSTRVDYISDLENILNFVEAVVLDYIADLGLGPIWVDGAGSMR
jgi:hypothetical protein